MIVLTVGRVAGEQTVNGVSARMIPFSAEFRSRMFLTVVVVSASDDNEGA